VKLFGIQILILLSLTAGAALLTKKYHPLAPALYITAAPLDDGEVTVEQALEWENKGDGVIWIDARPRKAYEKKHIPGAILLNEFEWDQLLFESYDDIANEEKPLVIYCGSYSCKASTKVAEKLRERRMPEVYVLKGGWEAWLDKTGG